MKETFKKSDGLSGAVSVVKLALFTSDISEGCREGFFETNKKTNYIARQETVRQIY